MRYPSLYKKCTLAYKGCTFVCVHFELKFIVVIIIWLWWGCLLLLLLHLFGDVRIKNDNTAKVTFFEDGTGVIHNVHLWEHSSVTILQSVVKNNLTLLGRGYCSLMGRGWCNKKMMAKILTAALLLATALVITPTYAQFYVAYELDRMAEKYREAWQRFGVNTDELAIV